MVFHAFKGDDETDKILHEIPKGARSKFIKESIKKAVYNEDDVPNEPKPKEKPIPTVRIKV